MSIVEVDLAKNVFQLHVAAADGAVVFRKNLSRAQFARFMADHRACDAAMKACPDAHHGARERTSHGHRVRLIAPRYVKPLIQRQKTMRSTMRFVVPRTDEQQARWSRFAPAGRA